MPIFYDRRSINATPFTIIGVDNFGGARNSATMLSGDQILARLKDARVRKSDIARALGLPSSRVAEMYGGRRQMKLDEAVTLVEQFQLEEASSGITPLTTPIARLLVQHVALAVGAPLDAEDPRVSELAADLRAFSEFASDRRVRDSIQAADGFLHGIRLRRTGAEASQRSERPRSSR
jgi:hypothetical protein